MEGWRKNGIQAPSALYWIQRYNGARYIGVTVYHYALNMSNRISNPFWVDVL